MCRGMKRSFHPALIAACSILFWILVANSEPITSPNNEDNLEVLISSPQTFNNQSFKEHCQRCDDQMCCRPKTCQSTSNSDATCLPCLKETESCADNNEWACCENLKCYPNEKCGKCQPEGKPCKENSECCDFNSDWDAMVCGFQGLDFSKTVCKACVESNRACNQTLKECCEGLVCLKLDLDVAGIDIGCG